MARASSGLAYPERFYAAASYVGFGGSPNPSSKSVTSKFSNDVALLLYALYQQVTAFLNFLICDVLAVFSNDDVALRILVSGFWLRFVLDLWLWERFDSC